VQAGPDNPLRTGHDIESEARNAACRVRDEL